MDSSIPQGLSAAPPPTLLTCEASGAEAEESSWEINTAGSGGAGPAQALVHLHLTARPLKAWGTAVEDSATCTDICPYPVPHNRHLNLSVPGRHLQWKAPGWSWHCPPLAQGELLHSSMSSSQRVPVNPGGQGVGGERRMRYTEVNLLGFPEDTPRAGEHGVTGGRYGKGSCVMQGQLSSLSGLQPSC